MRTQTALVVVSVVAVVAVLASAAPAAAGTDPATRAVAGEGPAAAATDGTGGDCDFPVERVDATGTAVRIESEPARVVTLNPSAAQTMWEIGARDRVVGATRHASNLEGFAEKKNVSGAGQTINNEEVVELEPDLVLAPNVVANDTVETLRGAGLTIYRFQESRSIDDIRQKTRLVGRLVGECEGAAETVAWMDERLAVVDEAVAGAERPRVIYAFFDHTPGRDTFIHTLLERAGGENVAATAGIEGYRTINPEILVQEDPEWIVLNDEWDEVPATPAYNGTTAVETDQVVVVDWNLLNRPGPRVVKAVSTLAANFHPDAYAAANGTAANGTAAGPTAANQSADGPASADGQTADDTTTDTAESPEFGESNGADGPGFGFAVALLSITVLAVLGGGRSR